LGELTRSAPIYFYADVRTNLIELGVIRAPAEVAVPLSEGAELVAGSVNLKEYPKERIDEVWVYYRIRDAAGDPEDEENFSQRFILVNPQEQDRRGGRSIKRIYTRWISTGGRDIAGEIANAYISRFQNPPIRVAFDLDARQGDIWLGDITNLISRQKQDIFGADRSDLNYQVIQAQESNDGHQFRYVAQSYEFFESFGAGALDSLTITIDPPKTTLPETDTVNQINLRDLYDSQSAIEVSTIVFVIAGGPQPAGGTNVGGGDGQAWSLRNPNDWPWSPDIEVRVEPGGAIAGRGGVGGKGRVTGFTGGGGAFLISAETPGQPGKTGFLVEYATTINNLGIIAGGGGGGGGSYGQDNTSATGGSGGGGAGRAVGPAGPVGITNDSSVTTLIFPDPGTLLVGGTGGFARTDSFGDLLRGGDGGDLGQAGQAGETTFGGSSPGGTGAAGGAAGNAIDGRSFVTYTNDNPGDIRGNEV